MVSLKSMPIVTVTVAPTSIDSITDQTKRQLQKLIRVLLVVSSIDNALYFTRISVRIAFKTDIFLRAELKR